MAATETTHYMSIAELAEREAVPQRYLEQIFLALKNAGIISSKAGARGGYRLRKSPREIRLLEIVRLVDGPVAPVRCVSHTAYEKCPHEARCALRPIMEEVRDSIAEILEGITLEKAAAEGIALLSSPLSAYEISGKMYGLGVPGRGGTAGR